MVNRGQENHLQSTVENLYHVLTSRDLTNTCEGLHMLLYSSPFAYQLQWFSPSGSCSETASPQCLCGIRSATLSPATQERSELAAFCAAWPSDWVATWLPLSTWPAEWEDGVSTELLLYTKWVFHHKLHFTNGCIEPPQCYVLDSRQNTWWQENRKNCPLSLQIPFVQNCNFL